MKMEILSLDMQVSDPLKKSIEQKLSKFKRYFDDHGRGEVKLQPEGKGVRAELTFKVRTHYFRSESVAEDAMSAVEQAIDRLEGHIRKYKSRMKKRVKDYSYMQAFLDAEEQPPTLEETEELREEFNIIRRKSFPISAMTTDEAILQMELLDHAFLIFLSDETGKVCVVYRRKDGGFGLLEPEY
ncbi:MAG: ribosome hibernation-promoting factor, HPF/YfiA family [Saccharofermentanales bacterium]|jgi:putative sigma-54 modulation protein|nr:ribosome-associated translation inhibitor RaiA [Clostridiaceae bacterium]